MDKCLFASKDTLKKQERGLFDYQSDVASNLLVCRWHDNSVAHLCSNAVGIKPIDSALHYSSSEKKRFQI